MAGKIFLVATPIGNLEDISSRALKTIASCDLLACEDTRNTLKLLNHFHIRVPMTSYHEYNKIEKAYVLCKEAGEGKTIALVSDAGMPGISDPGEELVRIAQEEGIEVSVVPGACAAISALAISGLSSRRFAFEGFLPSDKKERALVLEEMKQESRTMVLYEAPHRLMKTLGELRDVLGNRRISLVRELTKVHEEVFFTDLTRALESFESRQRMVRGEYVLVLEGVSPAKKQQIKQEAFREMDLYAHLEWYRSQGIEEKDAMKQVARDRGISKREVYSALLEKEGKR